MTEKKTTEPAPASGYTEPREREDADHRDAGQRFVDDQREREPVDESGEEEESS